MHEQFFERFGFQQTPFPVAPDPKKFFSTPAHDEALRQLLFGITSRKGLMLLTGEPGTGKTTVLHYLLEVLKRDGYSTAYVFHTLLPSAGVLRIILNDFGISCSSSEKSELLAALRAWLIKRRQLRDCPVILIDEAQALTDRTLDDLRMLLNLEVSGANLVQLVLAGQPQLETKLRRDRLKQLRQRVMCHCRLPGLSFDETVGYISTRLKEAGAGNPDVFSRESLGEIYHYSGGNLRTIHLLCERSLLNAYAAGRESVSDSDIVRVAQEFDLEGKAALPVEGPQIGGLSGLMSFPSVSTERIISQQKTGYELQVSSSPPAAAESQAAQAQEPPESETSVASADRNITAPPAAMVQAETEHELPLTLARAAFLVASEKFNAVDRRGKDALNRVVEAGKSVVWLGREQPLK